MRRLVYVCAISLLAVTLPLKAWAAAPAAFSSEGLAIAPLRQEVTVKPGVPTTGSFTVIDQTKQPITVTPSVEQFSVEDYSYNYKFQKPQNSWVKLNVASVSLKPGESQNIPFTITVPARTAPGGYYYTFFASTQVAGNGLPTTIQVTSLLYLTVNGQLIRTSVLQNSSVPFFVAGDEVPYKFDVRDTGNVYFSAFFYGQLSTIFGPVTQQVGTDHIVIQGAPRTINGGVPTPLLPGVYKLTYGYKVDFADFIVTKTAYVLFIPPWSFVAFIFLVFAVRWLWQRRSRYQRKKSSP